LFVSLIFLCLFAKILNAKTKKRRKIFCLIFYLLTGEGGKDSKFSGKFSGLASKKLKKSALRFRKWYF